MRISDWSSDVCSSDLKLQVFHLLPVDYLGEQVQPKLLHDIFVILDGDPGIPTSVDMEAKRPQLHLSDGNMQHIGAIEPPRSEEHTSELQSLMHISNAVFYLKTKYIIKLLSYTTH